MSQPQPKKPTRAELTEQKHRLVRGLINEQIRPGEIKRLFAQQFKTTPRAAERFITAVYQQIRAETGRHPEDLKADSYAFWQARASGKLPDGTVVPERDRQRARENLDRILGVYAPVKVAPTDTAGQDLPPAPARKLTLKELEAELAQFATEIQPGTDPGAN